MTRSFNEQVQWFLEYAATRKRNPVKPATLSNWRSCAEKWLAPNIGHLPCDEVNNKALKSLVEKFANAGLSAQSITNYVKLVKLALAASIDEEGEPLYPRKWNSNFIDMPTIRNQHDFHIRDGEFDCR